jgi:penicillin-binding protein 1C
MRALRIATSVLIVALLGAAAWFFFPSGVPAFAVVQAHWTPSDAYLLDRHGEVIDQERIDMHVRRFEWVPLEAVSPAFIAAVVDGEDHRFWEHSGVDWLAMLSVLSNDRPVRSGGSTITMQVSVLLDPGIRAGRARGSLGRKVAQFRMAHAFEMRWSKREILEAYLNLIYFRGELQGIGAASHALVGKAPSGLTLPESLVLAALLPAPTSPTDRVVRRACARATARHLSLSCADITTTATEILGPALAAAATKRRSTALQLAPHLAHTLLSKPGERVATTLDAQIQRLALSSLRQHLKQLTSRNVRDGAVLIVENTTGNVLAYVGSAGSQSRAREVDGVRAHRQAGSTLKPFLYELALERHYLTAASLLNDSPITLDTASGIYLPQNYDRDFKGLVSVRTALGSSLNVPAVRALMLVGVEPFRNRLHAVGYAGITQPGDFYGYSLALGSAEVSLWEHVQAYRTLARGGRSSPIQAQPVVARRSQWLLDKDASFIVADMMSDRAARTVTFGLDNHLNTPFWSAVKTGTSKDMRDNWCIGFSREFTVGVWVGNFEGDSMHDVSGVTGAAPVWQEIMLALHARLPSAPPEIPAGVTAQVADFSPAVEPPRTELFMGARKARPSKFAQAVEPAHAAQATPATMTIHAAGEIARIASPANGMVIAIDPDIPLQFQRVPLSARGSDASMVLRLNDTALGPANRNVMWVPAQGAHVLALEDASGHTLDSARFVVR